MNTTPTPERSAAPAPGTDALWQALVREPWRHDFFHALRWIDARHRDQPRLGTARRPLNEALRLGQAPDLSFAPAALHRVRTDGKKPRIEVRFFGLFGPNGPLPLHLTEYARGRILHEGDLSFSRFADLFHHRMLLLFYRAWAQAQPTVSMDRPDDDRFAQHVSALVGLGEPSLRNRDAAPDHARLYFSGLLSRQARNAEGLEKLLSGVTGHRVSVEQFVGAWLKLPDSERTRIGRSAGSRHNPTACLGRGAVLGGTVWDRQHNFRIHIGALDADAFDRLLPDGALLPTVVALVEHYVGAEFGWDLRLQHEAREIRPSRVGRHGRLGWTSWLGSSQPRTRSHLILSPSAAVRRTMKPNRVAS
jgi:type VI secretion system protein ImpH